MRRLSWQERRIRRVLEDRARVSGGDRDEGLLTYTEVGDEVSDGLSERENARWTYPGLTKPFRGLGDALGNISFYEHRLGRPLLSSLVVKNETRMPGYGFVDWVLKTLNIEVGHDTDKWVREEQQRVLDFWAGTELDPSLVTADAAFLHLDELIQRVRQDIRKKLGDAKPSTS